MSTPVEKVGKAPAWAGEESAQASGAGSGASPARKVYEVYSEEHGLLIRTRRPLRTLEKVTKHGFPAYLRLGAGWVYLNPESVQLLAAGEEITVPYMLEPPTFKGCKAYSYVKISADEVVVHG